MDTSIFFRVTASLGEGYRVIRRGLPLVINNQLFQFPPSFPSLRH